jgi:hypothetical protein
MGDHQADEVDTPETNTRMAVENAAIRHVRLRNRATGTPREKLISENAPLRCPGSFDRIERLSPSGSRKVTKTCGGGRRGFRRSAMCRAGGSKRRSADWSAQRHPSTKSAAMSDTRRGVLSPIFQAHHEPDARRLPAEVRHARRQDIAEFSPPTPSDAGADFGPKQNGGALPRRFAAARLRT